MEKAKLALQTVFDIVKQAKETGKVRASDKLKRTRLYICEMCEYYSKGKCSLCGCGMKIKVSFVAAKCPKGRWEEKMMEEALFGEMTPNFEPEKCCG